MSNNFGGSRLARVLGDWLRCSRLRSSCLFLVPPGECRRVVPSGWAVPRALERDLVCPFCRPLSEEDAASLLYEVSSVCTSFSAVAEAEPVACFSSAPRCASCRESWERNAAAVASARPRCAGYGITAVAVRKMAAVIAMCIVIYTVLSAVSISVERALSNCEPWASYVPSNSKRKGYHIHEGNGRSIAQKCTHLLGAFCSRRRTCGAELDHYCSVNPRGGCRSAPPGVDVAPLTA